MSTSKVTISEVAAEAGVSKSTVSKVLNHWTTISPETTKRVYNAIEKLHFIPNQRAVNFAKGYSMNVIYLANCHKRSAYENIFTFDIMCGASHELARHGYSIALIDTAEYANAGNSLPDLVSTHTADAMMVHASTLNEDILRLLHHIQIPHLIVGRTNLDPSLSWVDTDNTLAGRCAAKHIHDCGYKNVVYIAPQKEEYVSVLRLKGFSQEMLDNGHYVPHKHILYTDGTREGAYQRALSFFKETRPPAVDSVCCQNSLIALSVMRALDELGIKCPKDIGFLTFDTYPYSNVIDPAPTIIDVNAYDMGVTAADRILKLIKDPDNLIQEITTFPVLIQGETTCSTV